MALSKDEQAQLDALQAKASEPDDDDFEIEIRDEKGRAAKVPYRKGRSWLQSTFGIDVDPTPEPAGDDEGQGDKPKRGGGQEPAGGTAQKYFGGKGK